MFVITVSNCLTLTDNYLLSMRWRYSILLLLTVALSVVARLPGAPPSEGEVDHLYPSTVIVIGLGDDAHVLPYLLGWLENIDYPKKQLTLMFYTNGKEDSTQDQVSWWVPTVKNLFSKVEVASDSSNWMEDGLRVARIKKASRILLMTGDGVPMNWRMLQTLNKQITKESLVVVPYFSAIPFNEEANSTNFDFDAAKGRKFSLSTFAFPVYIDLSSMDASYITFDRDNLPFYEGPNDAYSVFLYSLSNMGIAIRGEASKFFGYWIQPNMNDQRRKWEMSYLEADWVADGGMDLVSMSRTVRSSGREPHRWDVDKIYVVNLDRRHDRMRKMEEMTRILGIDFERWSATDGLNYDQQKYRVEKLPGYLDPFKKRPMTAGEVGCFLSHYRIWEEVVAKGFDRVIVLEDDVRFVRNGLQLLEDTIEDLEKKDEDWDLVYLGRKKNSDKPEVWVPGHRHLSTVVYSYWTIGYMLSAAGAKKLVEAKPLEKLLPVDEYLPIMYDEHPNSDWSKHFVKRNLKAFTVYPVVVVPQRYTNEDGYVSDTETSTILKDNDSISGKKERGIKDRDEL